MQWIKGLAHYCILCGRWHVSSHTIKIHMRHHHPECFTHSEKATKLAPRVAGAFSPCLYCAQPRAHPRPQTAPCIVHPTLAVLCVCPLPWSWIRKSSRCVNGGARSWASVKLRRQRRPRRRHQKGRPAGKPNIGGKGRGMGGGQGTSEDAIRAIRMGQWAKHPRADQRVRVRSRRRRGC